MTDLFKTLEDDLSSILRDTVGNVGAVGNDGSPAQPAHEGVSLVDGPPEDVAVDGSPVASPGQSPGLPKRGRGAPLGNQNALKHGLYSRSLTPEQREFLGLAEDARHLEQELPLLRVKILSLLSDPQTDKNQELFLRAMGLLGRLVRIHHRVKYGS